MSGDDDDDAFAAANDHDDCLHDIDIDIDVVDDAHDPPPPAVITEKAPASWASNAKRAIHHRIIIVVSFLA